MDLMNLYHVFILALIQGLTEFLPVSSSAHLIFFPKLLQWQDQGIEFDVAIHVGTLAAVVTYFRAEIYLMINNWLKSLGHKKLNKDAKLAWAIIFGTIPVGLSGLVLHKFVATTMRGSWILALTTMGFAVILAIASLIAKQKRDEYHLTWKDILIVGSMQAIAVIPGVSRSGITLTGGLFAGLTRNAAARYSFLLSIPVIILAGGLEMLNLINSPQNIDYQAIILGFIVAAISGYLCIDLFLKFLAKYGVMPFVIYRLVLGTAMLFVL